MANATPVLSKLVLDHLFGNAVWTAPAGLYLALYTDTAGTTEVTGGSYARQTFTSPAVATGDQQTLSTAEVDFTAMPAVTVKAVGLCDALTAGNLLLIEALPAQVVVASGDTVAFAAGQIATKAY